MAYRSILNSEKLEQVTQKPNLLRKQRPELHEFELVRFGKGQIFGEVQHVVTRSLQEDPYIKYIFSQQAKIK